MLTLKELELVSSCEDNAKRARKRWGAQNTQFPHPDTWESTRLCKIIRKQEREIKRLAALPQSVA